MEGLLNLPWYMYIMLGVMACFAIYNFLKKGKQMIGLEPELFDAEFKKAKDNVLSGDQLFSISLAAVMTEYWGVHTNTLAFKKVSRFNDYMEGWGIDTKEGYWDLTNYFMEDGRRWYFDFIHEMIKTEPQEKWEQLMQQKFGDNERAHRYLNLLSTGKTLELLKKKGFITFDSEIEIGVAAYDASVLVDQARRAYSAQLITEKEAWEVIDFGTKLAKDNFSSWEDFGKSYILGFALDISHKSTGVYQEEHYNIYKQVVENPKSAWNTIQWPNSN